MTNAAVARQARAPHLFYKYRHRGGAWSFNYPVADGLTVTERQRRILQPPSKNYGDARRPTRP